MASLFETDIKNLKGVGNKTALLFENMNIKTIGDLIKFYPRSYDEWSEPVNPEEACIKKGSCIKIKITRKYLPIKLKEGKVLYKLLALSEDLKVIDIIFFNSKYLADKLKVGKKYLIKGNLSKRLDKYEIVAPKIKEPEDSLNIYPIYSPTRGITSGKIALLVKNALSLVRDSIYDSLPSEILNNYQLCSLACAYENIHFPKDKTFLKLARNRIIFEEFFLYHLSVKSIKGSAREKTNINISKDFSEEFYSFLPFKVTPAQRRVIRECMEDMSLSGLSMNRLLQGDVGSGKTVIASALAYSTAKNGYQAVLMAPTELLARQHYETLCGFLSCSDLNLELIHGSMKNREKKKAQENIAEGKSNIIVGTHALFSEKTLFKNLGLIVTDEQHRFGVKQRGKLVNKGNHPHVLVMSATPIPRSLALIMYGDLDVSILDQVLPGRQKIETHHIPTSKRLRMFSFLKELINSGGQIYIVCASIEEGQGNILDIEAYRKMLLSEGFSANLLEVLHGKMSPLEKQRAMQSFIEGSIKILLSTTVIEVGIDVPNANAIVIENAERFGISQLHQLRGRVGRGNKKSYCILVSDSCSKDSVRRFSAMVNSTDGFFLSEEDLKIRGPGDFFGSNQHGVPNISIPTTYEDISIIYKAQCSANEVIKSGKLMSDLKFKSVRDKLDSLKFSDAALGFETNKVVF